MMAWNRINEDFSGVDSADLLPGAGDEIILRCHADLQNEPWDPQDAVRLGWLQLLFQPSCR